VTFDFALVDGGSPAAVQHSVSLSESTATLGVTFSRFSSDLFYDPSLSMVSITAANAATASPLPNEAVGGGGSSSSSSDNTGLAVGLAVGLSGGLVLVVVLVVVVGAVIYFVRRGGSPGKFDSTIFSKDV
jgi:hypothetical protein